MSKELEQRRANATELHAVYAAVCDSIEPNITAIDPGAFYASAAISLKRIADVADLFAISLLTDHAKKDVEMAAWAQRHGFGDLWDKAKP